MGRGRSKTEHGNEVSLDSKMVKPAIGLTRWRRMPAGNTRPKRLYQNRIVSWQMSCRVRKEVLDVAQRQRDPDVHERDRRSPRVTS